MSGTDILLGFSSLPIAGLVLVWAAFGREAARRRAAARRRTAIESRDAAVALDRLLEIAPEHRGPRWSTDVTGWLGALAEGAGPELLPALIRCLFDGDAAVVIAAAQLLGLRPEPFSGAAVPLATVARDAPHDVQPACLWALRRLLAQHPELIELFGQDPSPAVRRCAVEAAGRALRAPSLAAPLRGGLEELLARRSRDEDDATRRLAWRHTGRLGPIRRPDLAVSALHDESAQVREAAIQAFAGGDAVAVTLLVRSLPQLDPAEREIALEALSSQEGGVPPALWVLAADAETELRRWVFEAVGALGTARDAAKLAAFLTDPRALLRTACGRALLAIATRHRDRSALRTALPQLLGAWRSEHDADALVAIAETLGLTGDEQAHAAILGRLETVPQGVRERLLEILARAERSTSAESASLSPLF